ncbi:hypothetical protein J9332_33825, partial [Aquimarina celericrescens]|nr:hypothetical protein [Aquimarina celericrescens]
MKNRYIKNILVCCILMVVGQGYAQDPIGDPDGNTLYYWDGDGDGYGATSPTIVSNSLPHGYADNNQDLDDSNSLITNIPPRNFYRDADGDGFGNPNNKKYQSAQPSGYITVSGDCNDGNDEIHPNTVWYRDSDNDTWGNPNVTKQQCTQPSGYIRRAGDYNDGNNLITNVAPRNF